MMLLTNIKAVGLVVSDEKIFNVFFFLKIYFSLCD